MHSLGLLGHHADQVPGFLIVAVIVGTGFYLLVERSRFGFDLRATGINPFAAQAGGVSSRKMILITMLISGAIAGLVALPYVMGTQHNYSDQLPSSLGFTGIAVALLGPQQAGRHRFRRAAVGVPRAVSADPRPQRHPEGDLRS